MNIKKTQGYVEKANDFFGFDMNTRYRGRKIVEARQMFFSWLRMNTNFSLREIAETLQPIRDHSTVIHNLRQHDNLMTLDKRYRKLFQDFEQFMGMVESETAAELVNRELTIHFPQYRLPSFVVESLNKII